MATYNFTKDTNQIVIENGNYGDLLNYSIKIESIQTREQPSLDNPAEILGVSGIIIKREEDNNIWNISLSDTVYDGLISNNKITITADITGGFILSEQQWQAKNNSSIIMANGSAADTIKINKDNSEVGNAWINSYKCNLVTFSNTSNVFRCFITNNHNLSREQWKEVYGPKINIQYPLSLNIIKDFILPKIKLLSGTNTFSIQYIYGEKEIILTESAIKQLIKNIKAADNEILTTANEYSDSLASYYATANQGAIAESALQPGDITTGENNGTIKIGEDEISVYGLGSAAYTDSSAYDAAGAADAAKTYADSLASNYDAFGAASAAETAAKTYADSLASNYDAFGAASAAQAASEPKKITGVIKIGPPSSATTQISNITKYYSNLLDAQSGNDDNAISFGTNFKDKTIIISPATDADWILWRDSGIRCSNQANISGNENSNGLTFKAEDNFSTTTSTYANIIILD